MASNDLDREQVLALLDHLERRRNLLDLSMWQAPGLTIAAQAFLLNVLTNRDIDPGARAWILAAGVVAVAAAALSLLRLRHREVRYSESIAYWAKIAEIPDPRPDDLKRLPLERRGFFAFSDRAIRRMVGWDLWPPVYFFWVAALLLFAVADVVAYSATN